MGGDLALCMVKADGIGIASWAIRLKPLVFEEQRFLGLSSTAILNIGTMQW